VDRAGTSLMLAQPTRNLKFQPPPPVKNSPTFSKLNNNNNNNMKFADTNKNMASYIHSSHGVTASLRIHN
jgi:hypothetical protein